MTISAEMWRKTYDTATKRGELKIVQWLHLTFCEYIAYFPWINVHTQIWYTVKQVKNSLVYVLNIKLLNTGVD